MLGRYRYDCRGGCWDVTGTTVGGGCWDVIGTNVGVGVGTLQV